MRSGLDLSMYLVKDRSWTLALPEPAPPPTWAEPEFDTPQLHASTSISPLWVLSFDSPLRASIFMNMSIAIFFSWEFKDTSTPRRRGAPFPGLCRRVDLDP